MDERELEHKVFSVLKAALSIEDFRRIQAVRIGESDELVKARLLVQVEKEKQTNLNRQIELVEKQKKLADRKVDKVILKEANEKAGNILENLAKYLKVKGIASNPMTLGIAMVYDEQGTLTTKQSEAIRKYNVLG
jgi:hypothetical protein